MAPARVARLALALARLAEGVVVVAVIVVTATAVVYVNAERTAQHEAEVQARTIVAALTESPLVLDAVTVSVTESPGLKLIPEKSYA